MGFGGPEDRQVAPSVMAGPPRRRRAATNETKACAVPGCAWIGPADGLDRGGRCDAHPRRCSFPGCDWVGPGSALSLKGRCPGEHLRQCSVPACGWVGPESQFRKGRCLPHARAAWRAWAEANPERIRASRRRSHRNREAKEAVLVALARENPERFAELWEAAR